MAVYELVQTLSIEAGSAVTVYRFVTQAADGQVDHTGAGARMSGIAAESIALVGDPVPVVIPNGARVKVEAGAAIVVGALVQSDANGKAITHVSAAGDFRGGVALSAAAADGDIIEIQFLVDEDQVT